MNELILSENKSISMWDESKKIEEIRKLFAPTLTEMEFQFFVGLGRASGLNPFTREIWAIKYDKNQPAQVFIGRDGYRKAAQSHKEYDYHQSDAVYEHDEFSVVNGEIHHKYTLKNRGKLVGAYCIAKRRKSSRPIYVFADVSEYSTGRSVWKDKPATMIKKVAESQCLRACFQDLLGGTYGDEEINERTEQESELPKRKSQNLEDKLRSAKGQTIDVETVIQEETGESITDEQLKNIETLLFVKTFDEEQLQSAMTYYKTTEPKEMTKEQADHFISILNKRPNRE